MFLFQCNRTHLIHYAKLQKRSTFSAKEINNVEKNVLLVWGGRAFVCVFLSHLFVIKRNAFQELFLLKNCWHFLKKPWAYLCALKCHFVVDCWFWTFFRRSQNIIFKENKHLIRMPNEVKKKTTINNRNIRICIWHSNNTLAVALSV